MTLAPRRRKLRWAESRLAHEVAHTLGLQEVRTNWYGDSIYGNANYLKGMFLKIDSRLCDGGGCVALYTNAGDVLDIHLMTLCYAVRSMECHGSYGTIVLNHLAADGAGFAGSQVTVVAIGQVDAHFGSSLHLELVHGLTSLGDIDLVVALHKNSLLCRFSGKRVAFLGKPTFSFRKHSLTHACAFMCGALRNLGENMVSMNYLQSSFCFSLTDGRKIGRI